jgi:predicted site-specific integrase-resolvase
MQAVKTSQRDRKEKQYVTVGEAAAEVGLESQTIRKLADNGVLVCYRTPAQQRRILLQSLYDFKANRSQSQGAAIPQFRALKRLDPSAPAPAPGKNILYARVPSKVHTDELKMQIDGLQRPEYAGFEILTDHAPSTDFTRKGLTTIIDYCLQGSIGKVVVVSRDILCRFAYDLIERLVSRAGGQIIVLDEELKSPPDADAANQTPDPIHTREQDLYNEFFCLTRCVFDFQEMKKRPRQKRVKVSLKE